jgi:hypothetical protein
VSTPNSATPKAQATPNGPTPKTLEEEAKRPGKEHNGKEKYYFLPLSVPVLS